MFTIMFPTWLSFLLLKPGPFPPSILTSPLSGAGLVRRYTAVVKPVQYQYSTGQSSCRRVSLMIVIVWMLAFAVSCPLLFGFNTTGTHGEKSFAKQMPRHIFPLSPTQMLRPGDVNPKEVADCLQPAAVPQLLPRGIPHQDTRDYTTQQAGREEKEYEAGTGGTEAQQRQNHQLFEASAPAAPADPASGEEGHTDASYCAGGIHSLLAALLLDSHPQHPLPVLPRAPGALQCQHLAWLRQQRPQPHHLHNLQHRLPQSLPQDPLLLTVGLAPGCTVHGCTGPQRTASALPTGWEFHICLPTGSLSLQKAPSSRAAVLIREQNVTALIRILIPSIRSQEQKFGKET
ncbi:D(3) dopamine receptor isoform X3 [Strix uralensis]|uniref:D(3) dopamine receptor isoform X3 n=1 Tax=Strix uralensis TaxID=36305 RepID=UPI003DA71FA6